MRQPLLALLRRPVYWLWALAALAAVFRLRVRLLPRDTADYAALASRLGVMFTGYTHTPQYNWVVVTMAYLWLFLLGLPLLLLATSCRSTSPPRPARP